MNEKEILKDTDRIAINKKTTMIIIGLIVIGVITGLIVNSYFITEANQDISEWNKGIDKWYERWENRSWGNYSWENNSWGNYTWGNETGNTNKTMYNDSNWSSFYQYLSPITYIDVIIPSVTVILLCISSYFLLALIVTYIKIYRNTQSKYVLGLLFVLIPLLTVAVFFIRVVKSLFFSSALEYSMVSVFLGFGIEGIGGMLSIISIFMIIGLGILLYLSNE